MGDMGTPNQLDLEGKILFIEKIDEATYKIDRALTQLLNSGILSGVRGIILGDFNNCEKAGEDDILIQMDPGAAFGTGLHETTKLCVSVIEDMVSSGGFERMIDIGCGTGILSLVASKLGVEEIVATDIDRYAVDITMENCEINGITNVKGLCADLLHGLSDEVIGEKFDLVVANILLNEVKRLVSEVGKLIRDGGTIVLSGITTEQVEILKDVIDKEGLEFVEIRNMNEWAVVIARK
jgi:ribosomal protein L11 methyltransferase